MTQPTIVASRALTQQASYLCRSQVQPVSFQSARQFSTEAQALPKGQYVFEATKDNFTPLIQASARVPVIIDCHAEWCEPCKQLSPRLIAAVKRLNGRALLLKVDTDKLPEVAQRLNVKELPTVIAVFQGGVLAGFTGNVTDAELENFMNTVSSATGPDSAEKSDTDSASSSSMEAELRRGHAALDQQDATAAFASYSLVLKDASASALYPMALAGLARCALIERNTDLAKNLVDKIKSEYSSSLQDTFVANAINRVSLAEHSAGITETIPQLNAKLAADPKDLQARYNLCALLFAEGKTQEAIDEGLKIVRQNRHWQEGAARKLLLRIFEALGPDHPAVKAGRARLTNLLL